MARIIPAFSQFSDDNGEPLVNGSLRFLESGSNNTEKPTYSDIAQTLPNTNPVKLSGAGRCPDVYGEGLYNIVSYDENDQLIEQFDPVGVDTTEGPFSGWNSVVIYDAETIVTASNGSYYRAITGTNQNNEPSVNPANWELIKITGEWNSVLSYSEDDAVYGSNGNLYLSNIGSNLNNDPILNPALWRFIGKPFRGCLVFNNTSIPIPHLTTTLLTYNSQAYDTDSIHSTTVNPGRLTVPSWASEIKIHASIPFAASATGFRGLYLNKNGSAGFTGNPSTTKPNGNVSVSDYLGYSSPAILVSGGDYFENFAQQTSGGSLNILGDAPGSLIWFAMEIIE